MDTSNVERRWGQDAECMRQMHEKINDYQTKEVLEVPAFTDDMTKAEMLEHLVEYHDCRGQRVAGHQITEYGCKATKGELMAFHDRVHLAQDAGNPSVNYLQRVYKRTTGVSSMQYEYRFTLGGFPFPKMRHRHGLVSMTAEQNKAVAAVRSNRRAAGEGILSVQDRKVLTQLVDNDFNALKQEMRAFAADSLAAKVSEINADWDQRETKIADFATQATDLQRKQEQEWAELRARHAEEQRKMRQDHEDAMKKITDKADEKGVVLSTTQIRQLGEDGKTWVNKTVYVATVQGRKDAIAGAEKENKTFLDRALLTLEKQRLTAQRQVLLSGVPTEAMPIVESIPDARALMVEAEEERAAKQLN